MATIGKIKIRLQGHEKFALRDGWITKGLMNVSKNAAVFQGKDAPDIFGIGNNMVKSLRYWMKAFNLISENPSKGAKLTELGEIIYQNDPYIEDNFTLWILHSQIATNIEEATSWYMFFNRCDFEDSDKSTIENIVTREISKYVLGQSFSSNSVKNDIDVILNMYGKIRDWKDPEDKNILPFASLGLIRNVDGVYSKSSPDSRSISVWVILYGLANIMEQSDNISIEKALYGDKGIFKIYQLKNVVANEMLDKIEAMDYIRVDRTAGLDIIYKKKEFSPNSILLEYYNNRGK